MIEFYLVIQSERQLDQRRELVSHSVLPRIGETVCWGGQYLKVVSIEHRIEEAPYQSEGITVNVEAISNG